GSSFTADTLRRLHASGYTPSELFFITGADAFAEIATWKDYPALLDLAHFAVVSRPGLRVAALPGRLPDLASRMGTVDEAGLQAGRATSILLIDAATPDVSSTTVCKAQRAHR